MSINSNNSNIIFEGHIFRDSSSRLIIPDDIYDALSKSKCATSYEFAMQFSMNTKGSSNDYNYYASWFILAKNDGGINKCIKASKIKGAKNSDEINKMIEAGKMLISQVSINSAEEVFESRLKTELPEKEDKSADEYYAFIEKETKSIEAELGEIASKLTIKTKGDYNDLKDRLKELKDRCYYAYSKSLGFSYGNNDIQLDAEKRYNILCAKTDAVIGKLELIFDETLGSGIINDKNYYSYSDEKYPALIENKLKDIKNEIDNYTESEYTKIKKEFSNLYDEAYAVYQLVLNSATDMDCMTKVLLDEAIKKYKSTIEIIGKEEQRLEVLHNKNKPLFGSLIKKPQDNI